MNADMVQYPCNFVIFGATGNLASNKLLPALYHLEGAQRLPAGLSITAFGRREWDDDSWREHVRVLLQEKLGERFKDEVFNRFGARFSYVRGELHDPQAYQKLREELGKPKTGACSNVVYYLAIKPTEFAAVINNLDAAGLNKPRGMHRVVV